MGYPISNTCGIIFYMTDSNKQKLLWAQQETVMTAETPIHNFLI